MPLRRLRGRWGPLVAAVVVLVISACSSANVQAHDTRTAGVYVAVLRKVVPPVAEGEDPSVVYVAPFPDQKSVTLETQAAVVVDLADQVTVRFVDALSEAIDKDTAGSPPKEGLVVLLGPVAQSGSTVEVEAERYFSETDRVPLRFHVAASGSDWTAETVVTPASTTSP